MTAPAPALVLTATDKANLHTLQEKFEHIRAAVRGIVKHYHTGLFLWGEGGTGKSYAVYQELQDNRAKYTLHNSRLTARGLVDELMTAPAEIHLIEDAESLFLDNKAAGVLRSALYSQSRKKPPERYVTWTAFKTRIRFLFTGGIIVISNANLADDNPEIRAIKTRITVLRLDVTPEELLALQKKICLDGFRYGEDYLAPEECWEVGLYIQDRLTELRRPLDLRLLLNGFKDYLQHKNGDSGKLTWQDLMDGRFKEAVQQRVRRADRIKEEVRIALEIDAMKISKAEKLQMWMERTDHKSPEGAERSYYRRLADSEKLNKKK
jgi:hypothetical protein